MWSRRRRQRMTLVVLFVTSILLACVQSDAVAQLAEQSSTTPPPNVLAELAKLKREVQQLRERDANRQPRQGVVKERPSNAELTSAGWTERVSGSDADNSRIGAQRVSGSASEIQLCQSCEACGGDCWSCQCPSQEAPCIDCPHVSTLTPYFNVNFFGALVGDMLFNEARPLSPGAPYYLSPASASGRDESTVDLHGRSSYFAAALSGPHVGDLQAGGMAMVFFYNDNVVADQYGILPAQVYGDLKNDDWRFAAGLQFDVFNPGAPTMLAFSALAGAGNAGNAWRGQIRAERFLKPIDDVQWTFQAALSEPISTVIDPSFSLLSEDNGWPNVEGRVALGLGALDAALAKRPFEVGVSGVVGEIRSTPLVGNRVINDVWGTGIDFFWKVNDIFGVAGELYTGKALGTYNGAILQNVNAATFEGIRSAGGWGEFFLYWTQCMHSHIGYAIDNPDDGDLSTDPMDFQRERNETFYSNLLWDINQSFRVGFEFTWRETDNTSVLDNEGAGFHTQFRWTF